jgi:predicted nucleic acid-binding protein
VTLYLLDTGPLSAYLAGRPAAIELIAPWIERKEVLTSILAYGEIVEYFKSLPSYEQRETHLRRVLRTIKPCALTYSVLSRYAAIRRAMRPPYGPGLIGDIDTLFASTALDRDLTIVTMDSDFQRVPELRSMIVNVRR